MTLLILAGFGIGLMFGAAWRAAGLAMIVSGLLLLLMFALVGGFN